MLSASTLESDRHASAAGGTKFPAAVLGAGVVIPSSILPAATLGNGAATPGAVR
jgi:hypothetical protein